MESFFIRSWWVPALRGALGILFGVLAVALPGLSLLALIALFAAWAMLAGCAAIAGALRHRRGEDDWLLVLSGLASMAFGAIVFLYPGAGALALVWLISLYAVVTGGLLLGMALRVRRLAPVAGLGPERRVRPDRRMSLAR